MKRVLIILTLLLATSFGAFAQQSIKDLFSKPVRQEKPVVDPAKQWRQRQILDSINAQMEYLKNVQVETLNESLKDYSDAQLYRDIIRKYSWWEGLGEPIDHATAMHLPYYYRLSMKNEKGHYQLVEALHHDTLTTHHPLGTYLLDKDEEDNINQYWRQQLRTVGQWVMYPDPSGEDLAEERAYEAKQKDAKLVYSMQVIRNDSLRATLSYTNSFGYPADMNENDENIYGSVVMITYDNDGRDYIIDFLDGGGYRKLNLDGVDQRRYYYDKEDRKILVTSNNCLGDIATDNWGNAGVMYVYDMSSTYSKVNLDVNLEPTRMPDLRASAVETFVRCDFDLDEWGRVTTATMLTAEGEPDATLGGIHKIVFDYDNDGMPLSVKYYDLNNQEITIEQ